MTGSWQAGHCNASALPHWLQKRAPVGFSKLQAVQCIGSTSCDSAEEVRPSTGPCVGTRYTLPAKVHGKEVVVVAFC